MAIEDALAAVIRRGIETERPHAGPTGPGPFSGSFDWHSCVHAHWALACMGRVRDRADLRRWIEARLPPDAIEAERAFLGSVPSFERPYGRAWFVLLLAELSRTRPEVRSARDAAAAEMRDWLDATSFPEGEDGALVATHDSWLFAFLLLLLARPEDGAVLRDLLARRVLPHHARIRGRRYRDEDFIDLGALLATIRLVLGEGEVESTFAFARHATDPEPEAGSGHACGREVLALWPAAAAASRGDARAAQRFEGGIRRIEARPERWREDFARVGHWVPQFVWLALWLRGGRP